MWTLGGLRIGKAWFPITVFLVSFVIRVLAVETMRDWNAGPALSHGADGVEYDALARQVVSKCEYSLRLGRPTSFRAPGFPLALSLVYATFGLSYPVARLFLCLLGAASCVATYLLARELMAEGWARAAAVLSALYPPHVLFATRFESENLFVPLLGVGLWLLARQFGRWPIRNLVLSGLLLGYGALVRSFMILLLPIFLAVLVGAEWRKARHLGPRLVAFALPFVAVVGLWTARNLRVHGRPVLIATNGGSTFYGGNNPLVAHDWALLGAWVSTVRLPGRDLIEATPDEVSHDLMEWKLGWRWVSGHPQELPVLVAAKVARLFLPDLDSPNHHYVLFQILFTTPFLVLFLIGLGMSLRQRQYWTPGWLLLHGTLLCTLLTGIIFYGSTRFRDANLPVLMAYAALGLSSPVFRSWVGALQNLRLRNRRER